MALIHRCWPQVPFVAFLPFGNDLLAGMVALLTEDIRFNCIDQTIGDTKDAIAFLPIERKMKFLGDEPGRTPFELVHKVGRGHAGAYGCTDMDMLPQRTPYCNRSPITR